MPHNDAPEAVSPPSVCGAAHDSKQTLDCTMPAPMTQDARAQLVARLLAAKEASKLTFDEIAQHCGLTNAYAAQLFFNQAHLKPATAAKLRELVAISQSDLALMQLPPMRTYDVADAKEPLIYRLLEGVNHYGTSIKALVNEKFGVRACVHVWCGGCEGGARVRTLKAKARERLDVATASTRRRTRARARLRACVQDGIMSAIDFFVRVDKVQGAQGEQRVVVTFNGKYLPYNEQLIANDTSPGAAQ